MLSMLRCGGGAVPRLRTAAGTAAAAWGGWAGSGRRHLASRPSERFQTKCATHRDMPATALKGLSTPIVTASTFAVESAAAAARLAAADMAPSSGEDGFFYSRWASPTVEVAAAVVADLEGVSPDGPGGTFMFSSGMAAISSTVLACCKSGDHVVLPKAAYGGTHQWFAEFGVGLGVDVTFVDGTSLPAFDDAIQPNTKLLIGEVSANPTLRVTDVEALGQLALDRGVYCMVDATFASPYCMQPVLFPGVSAVIHSATKYLGGHSDLLAGTATTRDPELLTRIGQALRLFGASLSPHDAYALVRSMKTLPMRMKQHCESAQAVAEFLEADPRVNAVHFPGLASHPDHAVAARLWRNGYGGMMAFDLGTVERGAALVENVRLARHAVSLGSVETLAQCPASSTHAVVPREVRLAGGITDGLVRFSVGLEDPDDLIADLDQALPQ